MKYFRHALAAVVFAASIFSFSASAMPVLVTDQIGASTANGGDNNFAVQTFTPAADNIAGVDILIGGTAVLSDDITLSIYSDAALTDLLVSSTIFDHPRDTIAEFRWDAVALTPETVYYMLVETGSLLTMVFVSNITDAYSRGDIVAVGGGNTAFNFIDAVFTTYSDENFVAPEVPLPAAAWLFLSGIGAMFWRARKKHA